MNAIGRIECYIFILTLHSFLVSGSGSWMITTVMAVLMTIAYLYQRTA